MWVLNRRGDCPSWWVSGCLSGEGGRAVVLAQSALGVGACLVLLQLAVVLLEVQTSSLFAAAHRKILSTNEFQTIDWEMNGSGGDGKGVIIGLEGFMGIFIIG